jgi:hypothetical protein
VPPDNKAGPLRVLAAKTIALPKFQREIEELQALGIPSEEKDTIESMFADSEKGVEEIEKNAAHLEGRPPALEKANELAHEYGFKICVQD